MASRVHDSVLQTLALIQREADDPRRIATLARRQERELRGWLYPDGDARRRREPRRRRSRRPRPRSRSCTASGSSSSAIGDRALDDRLDALVLAAREAMANAARHSGVDEVAVFAEAGDDGVAVFVRDRGGGFDPAARPGRPARDRGVDPRPDGARRRHGDRDRGAGRGRRGGAAAA